MHKDRKKPTVGLVGLGSMGRGMAASLRRAGFDLFVHDRNEEAARQFVAEGGTVCTNAAELAARAAVVVSVVVDAAQTEEVLLGNQGVVAGAKEGCVFVMCSTIAPEVSAGFAERLEGTGIAYLDAPISGGATLAESGSLSIMAGGSATAFARAEPALNAMGANVFHVGTEAGAGNSVKLINQLLVATHVAAAAESVALALRMGIDLDMLYRVITTSAGSSRMFEMRVPDIIRGDYTPTAALDILIKDLGLVLSAASERKASLPLGSTAHQMFLNAGAAGFGREASAAVVKIFPGIDLPAPQKQEQNDDS